MKKKTKKDEKLEANDLYSDFKEKQEVYRKKTASNKFSKVDFNAGKVKRKAREADTMAMLNGFKTKIHKAKDEDTPAGNELKIIKKIEMSYLMFFRFKLFLF